NLLRDVGGGLLELGDPLRITADVAIVEVLKGRRIRLQLATHRSTLRRERVPVGVRPELPHAHDGHPDLARARPPDRATRPGILKRPAVRRMSTELRTSRSSF